MPCWQREANIYARYIFRAVNGESKWSEKCTCTHALTLCLAPFVAKRKLPTWIRHPKFPDLQLPQSLTLRLPNMHNICTITISSNNVPSQDLCAKDSRVANGTGSTILIAVAVTGLRSKINIIFTQCFI